MQHRRSWTLLPVPERAKGAVKNAVGLPFVNFDACVNSTTTTPASFSGVSLRGPAEQHFEDTEQFEGETLNCIRAWLVKAWVGLLEMAWDV